MMPFGMVVLNAAKTAKEIIFPRFPGRSTGARCGPTLSPLQ
jgi:hypothetical protein